MSTPSEYSITPRQGLDFDLASDIPRFWFAGNPFKTRLFDAHSLLTPAGEYFFIQCLRAYQDEVSDPGLREAVKNFILQEGQHSMQHRQSNQRLKAQGVDVAAIESYQQQMAERARQGMSRSFAMALTAAYEHLTTITAHAVMEHAEYFTDTDPHIFALYAWHCAEELEHKAVCFDVMQQVAGVGYFTRIFALVAGTGQFQLQAGSILNQLLRRDGFGFWQRLGLWCRGLHWMYGRKGFFRLQMKHYFAYFHPRFHPARYGEMSGYARWADAFRRTNNPLMASQALQPSSIRGPWPQEL